MNKTMKRCNRCGFQCELEVAGEYFRKRSDGKDGYRSDCKACEAEYFKQYRKANREARASYYKQYYADNKENELERVKQWQKANQYKRTATKHKRRARILGNGGAHTAQEIENLYKQQNGKCAYCQIDVSSGYHVDHRLAISRGGTNDISNISLACAKCNLSKGNKTLSEWIIKQQTAGLLDGLELGF